MLLLALIGKQKVKEIEENVTVNFVCKCKFLHFSFAKHISDFFDGTIQEYDLPFNPFFSAIMEYVQEPPFNAGAQVNFNNCNFLTFCKRGKMFV